MAKLRTIILLLTLTLIGPGLATADDSAPSSSAPLTNVAQIRRLTSITASKNLPVLLRGVMLTDCDPRGRAIILADQTGAIYLRGTSISLRSYRRGDLLEIEGVSDPGQFAPMVRVNRVQKLGVTTTPPPQPVSYHQLLTGALDAQWVELRGVVRRYIAPAKDSDVFRILVGVDGGVLPARGPLPIDPNLKEDAEVVIQAVCLYQFNQRRQVLTPILQMAAGTNAIVVRPAPANPFAAPIRSAATLYQFSPDAPAGHRVHVRGVVLYAEPGAQIWIRDATSGLRILARQEEPLQPGDEIDVLGFPVYGAASPLLEDATYLKIGSKPAPLPAVITNLATAFDHEDNLIQIDAQLTQVQPSIDGQVLSLANEGTVLRAILKQPTAAPWLPGSKIRVTGICSVIHDDPRPMIGVWQPQSFQILLRNPDDVVVLSQPPWWNTKRLTWGLAAASALLLLATGVVVFVSRQRLKEQSHRRAMAETEFAAILTERNRVAREIHDTLAQGLAATSVQLRLAKKQASSDPEKLQHHIDSAQQLVRDSLEEARSSIWNMRSQVLETGDLVAAVNGILKQMADGTEVRGALEVIGRPRRFAPVIENNLLRVGQEAITNAARHSGAKHVKVFLEFGEKQFRLTVTDDGVGFDPDQPPPTTGGFGLVGMKERATEVKGTLHVRSQPDQGTEITLTLPLSGE